MAFIKGALIGLMAIVMVVIFIASISIPLMLCVRTDNLWWALLYFVTVPLLGGFFGILADWLGRM